MQSNLRDWLQLVEAVFTTAPLKRTIWGNQHAPYSAFQSDEPVTIYHRLSAAQMQGLLRKRSLRAVITDNDVYVADASLAAHAGMRSVLEEYGIDTSSSINCIITGPQRIVYAFGKYFHDAGNKRKWRAIRQTVIDNPRIKIMFPNGVAFVRDEWT